ncbi:MAG TPA: DUF5615 family PIN-like protein [Bryobacteraceae bacterium]|jgi:predicted nuclease of predicted toxin-antitoxin system
MRVLIDECVDPRVKTLFTGHIAATVHEKGWDSLEDGALLLLAEKEFDVLVTIDRNLEFQQNLAKLGMGVIVVHVTKNQFVQYVPLRDALRVALERALPGRAVHVGP